MPVPETPWWYLTLTPLAFGKRGGVLLQYLETVFPVLVIIMVSQAVTGLRGPWAAGKGACALRHSLWGNDVKYLRDMFYLTDRQPFLVNLRLHTMHTTSECCH